MSLLIYAESADGKFKKVAFELASYAKKVAESLGTTVTAVTVNAGNVSDLSKYGVDKVLKVSNDTLAGFSAKSYADVIKQAAQKENAKLILLSSKTEISHTFDWQPLILFSSILCASSRGCNFLPNSMIYSYLSVQSSNNENSSII